MPKIKEEKIVKSEAKSDTFEGLVLGNATVLKSEDVILNGKEVKKLTLSDGTTQLLSVEVLKELI